MAKKQNTLCLYSMIDWLVCSVEEDAKARNQAKENEEGDEARDAWAATQTTR